MERKTNYERPWSGRYEVHVKDIYDLHGKTFETHNGYLGLNANSVDKEIKVEMYTNDDWCLFSYIQKNLNSKKGMFLFLEFMKSFGYVIKIDEDR